jgi:hypothetical protein
MALVSDNKKKRWNRFLQEKKLIFMNGAMVGKGLASIWTHIFVIRLLKDLEMTAMENINAVWCAWYGI